MLNLLALCIVDKVRRQVAAIELHALDNLEFVCKASAFFDRDDTLFSHFLHGVGNDLADFGVRVGRDAADLSDRFLVFTRFGQVLELCNDCRRRFVDAALEVHRIHAGSNRLQAFTQNGLHKNGCRRRTVTGDIRRLGSNFLDHLCAHILEFVFELDFLGDRDTVFGDRRRAEALVEHDVAAFRTQGNSDGVCQDVHACEHLLARVVTETYFFSSHFYFLC